MKLFNKIIAVCFALAMVLEIYLYLHSVEPPLHYRLTLAVFYFFWMVDSILDVMS